MSDFDFLLPIDVQAEKLNLNFVLFSDVQRDSTPGVPVAALGGTNEDVIRSYADTIAFAVVERIRILAELGDRVKDMTPEQLVQCGACDPVRLFVKQEPHLQEKILSGRFRLICSVSLIDQCVERVLFGVQNRFEIASWKSVPSKPGMGLDDKGIAAIIAEVRPHLKDRPVQMDIRGWDWSVQCWEQDGEAEMRIRLHDLKWESRYARAIRARMAASGLSVFVLSNGRLIAQRRRGVMKSGQYITSSSNSRIRILASKITKATWSAAMGDDSLETPSVHPSLLRDMYSNIGHTVKDFTVFEGDQFTFCSTTFDIVSGKGAPANWHRSFYRLLCHEPITEEFRLQFAYELRHSPHLPRCMQVLSLVGRERGKTFEQDGSSHISVPGIASSSEDGSNATSESRLSSGGKQTREESGEESCSTA